MYYINILELSNCQGRFPAAVSVYCKPKPIICTYIWNPTYLAWNVEDLLRCESFHLHSADRL